MLLILDVLLQEGSVTRAAKRLGLSVAATSHALARIRRKLKDPVLVRAGRKMVLTPRANQLRPRVRQLVEESRSVFESGEGFSPRELSRRFTIYTTDHVLLVLGPVLDRIVRAEAPGVSLRFLPSSEEDWVPLRDGAGDVAVCILGHFPSEFHTRALFTDRFVCVVRQDHPRVGDKLTLDEYLALEHIVVSPLGRPSQVDAVLAERGRQRRIQRVVPFFVSGLLMAAATDYVLTVSYRAAAALAGRLALRTVEPPISLPTYDLNLLWHPRVDNEPANQWLRAAFVRAAEEVTSHDPAPGCGSQARRS